MRCLIPLSLVAALGCGRSAPAPAGGEPRVVTLTPSASEVVGALGAGAMLVGVDDYSVFPPEVAALPKVGNFLQPNLDVIVRLRPTLVIADDVHADVARALDGAGVATLSIPVHALPDVERALTVVGDRLGRGSAATAAIADMEGAVDGARAAAAKRGGRRVRVLAVIDHEAGGVGALVAVGPGTWIDELLAMTGADNVLASSGERYPKIALEEVLRAKPDVILDIGKAGSVDAWRDVDVPAVTSGRVRVLDEPFLMAPSPRVRQAIAAIEAALR